jgi:hypothetical protein
MTTNGTSLAKKNGYPEPTENDHACPSCGAPIPCDFKVIAQAKAHAKSEFMIASNLERRLLGLPLGAPRKLNLTPEQCREMVTQFGSINRARKQLGVGYNTFVRYMTGDKTKR